MAHEFVHSVLFLPIVHAVSLAYYALGDPSYTRYLGDGIFVFILSSLSTEVEL